MKLLAIFIVIFGTLLGCNSSDKKEKSPIQNNVSASEAMLIAEAVQDSLIAKKYTAGVDTSGLIKKTGLLNYTGNEPFAVPAIFGSDGNTYRLLADSTFITETFKTIIGKQVSLYGQVKQKKPYTVFEVHYYELTGNK